MPILDLGMIFTAGLDKGSILEFILSKYNYYPSKIIFIDDLLDNLQSIQKLTNKLDIDFQGFHYKAVSMIPLPDVNLELEKIRFSVLLEKHLWLNYVQIKNLNNL